MTRMRFGGGPGDVYLFTDTDGDLHAGGGFNVLCYDGPGVGATAITDLRNAANAPITYVTTADGTGAEAAGQIPVFYGPDDVFELWVSINSGPRLLLSCSDLGPAFQNVKDQVDFMLNSGNPNPTNTSLRTLIGVDSNSVDAGSVGSTLVKLPSGLYGAGAAPIPLADTIWVAASNAPGHFQSAQYVCDGTNDHLEIQAALDNALGMRVGLSPGTFNLAAAVVLYGNATPTDPNSRYLFGSGQSSTILNIASTSTVGVYMYYGVAGHLWDMTIKVSGSTSAVVSVKPPSGDPMGFNGGTLRRLTIAGPTDNTSTGTGINLRSAVNFSIEDVTVTQMRNGMNLGADTGSQVAGYGILRRCTVTAVGNSARGFSVQNAAGFTRAVIFESCAAIIDSVYTSTRGFQLIGSSGETSGIRLINCVARGWDSAVYTDSGAYELDIDLAYAEVRSAGTLFFGAGFANKYRCREWNILAAATSNSISDTNSDTALPNVYDVHITTNNAANIVTFTNTTGVVERGVVEGPGSVAATLQRNPSQLIDKANITPTSTTTVANIGTVQTGFTVASAVLRTALDGQLVHLRLQLTLTAAITVSGVNITDTACFNVLTAYRPLEAVSSIFTANATNGSTGGTGEVQLNSDGNVQLRTSDGTLPSGCTIYMNFTYLRG